jgi:uncharacterized protein YdhG (YjbR/CyaY superfamily)
MTAKPTSIDEYLAALSGEKRAALEQVRKRMKSAAQRAEECISYGLPAFRLNGKPLMAFGAATTHCALYPMSALIVAAFKHELETFDTSKGAIRFQPNRPLPAGLLRKLVKARMAENAALSAARKEKP